MKRRSFVLHGRMYTVSELSARYRITVLLLRITDLDLLSPRPALFQTEEQYRGCFIELLIHVRYIGPTANTVRSYQWHCSTNTDLSCCNSIHPEGNAFTAIIWKETLQLADAIVSSSSSKARLVGVCSHLAIPCCRRF